MLNRGPPSPKSDRGAADQPEIIRSRVPECADTRSTVVLFLAGLNHWGSWDGRNSRLRRRLLPSPSIDARPNGQTVVDNGWPLWVEDEKKGPSTHAGWIIARFFFSLPPTDEMFGSLSSSWWLQVVRSSLIQGRANKSMEKSKWCEVRARNLFFLESFWRMRGCDWRDGIRFYGWTI